MPEVTDYAWLAGLIDGDGSFWSQPNRNGGRSVFLGIFSVHEPTMQHVHTLFGGRLYSAKHQSKRLMWNWQIGGDGLYELAKQLLPYLVTKRRRAECVVEIGYIRGWPKPERDYARILELCDMIKADNYIPEARRAAV